MKLLNKNSIKTYGLTQFIGGNMGTSGYRQGIGKAFVFHIDGYTVVKKTYYDRCTYYEVSGKNIIDYISMKVLDMSEVDLVNENLRVDLLSTIMNADLTRVKNIMTTNKKGFTLFMENLTTENLSKDLSFASVIQDYYFHKFDFSIDTNAIIKVMIKYGYEFTNMLDANKLIR